MANPDWASFPPDLLLLILKNLPSPSDFVSFHCVCKGWRSAARQSDGSPSLPLLLDHDVFPEIRRLHFYSPFSTESLAIRIPQVGTKWVAGLSQGYLIAFDKVDFSLSLFNPFTRHSIPLPPLPIEQFKSLLSFRPYLLQNRETVVISHLDQRVLKLGRCKVGDQEWSFVSCKIGANGGGNVYYQGKYFVNESAKGPTGVINPATSDLLFTIPPPENRIPHLNSWKSLKGFDYLVESPMGLLRIFRPFDVFAVKNCNFDIHRLVSKDGYFRWVKAGSIGDLILFLDKFNGICARTDGVQGMRGNCIYFTKYRLDGLYGWRGILCRYDIASGDTVALPHCLETRGSWFVPSLTTIPD